MKLAEWMMLNLLPLGEVYNLNVPDGAVRGIRSASVSNEYIFAPKYAREGDGYVLCYGPELLPETQADSDLNICRAGYAALSIIGWNMLAHTQMPDTTALSRAVEGA